MMNKIIFLLVISFLSIAYADEITVRKEGSEVIMRGTDCDQLMKQAEAINHWRSSEPRPLNKEICKCETQCSINITAILPQSVVEKDDTAIIKPGPNSWNSSLVETGILSHHRYTQTGEMSFWMNSPLCKERAADDPAKPGDIIAIREFAGDEVHSFINLTEELGYSKSSYKKGSKYSITNPTTIYNTFAVPKDCLKTYKKPTDAKTCPKYTNVYKCDSMDEYLKKNPMHDKDLRDTWKSIDELDCQLSKFTFKDTFTQDQANTILMSVMALQELSQTQIDSSKTSSEDKFLWKAIKFKTISLVEQIGFL